MTDSQKQNILISVVEHIRTEWKDRPIEKIPHASTFLNQERWEDELGSTNGQQTKAESYTERVTKRNRETAEWVNRELSSSDGDSAESGDTEGHDPGLLPRPQ